MDRVSMNKQSINTINDFNQFTVNKLKQIAIYYEISPCGVKEKLINKINRQHTLNEVKKMIKTNQNKKYLVRFSPIIDDDDCIYCHIFFTNKNYHVLSTGKYGNKCICDKCKTNRYIDIYDNIFYEESTIKSKKSTIQSPKRNSINIQLLQKISMKNSKLVEK